MLKCWLIKADERPPFSELVELVSKTLERRAGYLDFSAMDPLSLAQLLENGQRLDKPLNSACSDTMYTHLIISMYDVNITQRAHVVHQVSFQ